MEEEPPRVRSVSGRLVAYLRHNAGRIVLDLAVMLAWIVLSSTAFAILELPTWLLYIVLFTGVVVYARLTPPWERPYRSPD